MMLKIDVDDIVMLKNDNRLWQVKSLFVSTANVYEAFLEICGEAWCRTKTVPVDTLSVISKDLSSYKFMLD